MDRRELTEYLIWGIPLLEGYEIKLKCNEEDFMEAIKILKPNTYQFNLRMTKVALYNNFNIPPYCENLLWYIAEGNNLTFDEITFHINLKNDYDSIFYHTELGEFINIRDNYIIRPGGEK